MAQLIARSVWDREVEGLSPFTPTMKSAVHLGGFFHTWAEDSNLRPKVLHSKRLRGRRFDNEGLLAEVYFENKSRLYTVVLSPRPYEAYKNRIDGSFLIY